MGRSRPRAGLAGDQRQQTQPDARPAEARGDRHRQAARRRGGRGDGKFSSRRDGQARHRLRRALCGQPEADLLRDLGLRPDRPGTIRRRLRRQDPGDVGHHGDHGSRGDRADARGLCGLRRAVRRHRRVRRIECAVPAHPHRQGADGRRLHARGDAGVSVGTGGGLHRRRPSSATVRQSGRQPQADRQSVQGGRRLFAARREQREAIPVADDRTSAAPTRWKTRASPTGSRGRKTSRRCGPSSRRRLPGRTRASGRRSSRRQARPAPASGRSRR